MTIINKPRKQSMGKWKSSRRVGVARGESKVVLLSSSSSHDVGDVAAATDLWSIVNLWTILGQRVSHIAVILPPTYSSM